jgi:hypothetical protein
MVSTAPANTKYDTGGGGTINRGTTEALTDEEEAVDIELPVVGEEPLDCVPDGLLFPMAM